MGVSQVVEADAREIASLDDAIEELGDRFGVEEAAAGVAEHPVVGFVWERLSSQPAPPVDEDVSCVVVEFNGASAGACFDAELDGFAADVLQRFQSIDDFAPSSIRLIAALDDHFAAARAEAVFNAVPRRFSAETQANTRQFRELVLQGLPDLDEREQLRIAAVIRCLISSQAWLRMREEFGIPRTESGPVVAWVIDTIFRECAPATTPLVLTRPLPSRSELRSSGHSPITT